MRYWLFKSEPSSYSFEDLVRDDVAEWDGVRNFQARNFLRDEVKKGDRVLFYHSNVQPLAVIGTAVVVREGHPDHTAWDPGSAHPDPKSTPGNPVWFMVDITADERFPHPVTMEEMRADPRLEGMVLLRRSRLSIQPVSEDQFNVIRSIGMRDSRG